MLFGKKKQDVLSDDRIQVDTRTITTMVGQDTIFEGKLFTKSSIRINGTVIGDVRVGGVVVLTKTGHIEGTVEAESIIVAGRIDGNMSIRDKVNVEATGKIYGDVITKKFVIDEESIFQGNCIMNRDGKVVPVPPYKKSSDKAEEDEKSEKKKSEKDEKSDKPEKSEKEEKADKTEKSDKSEKPEATDKDKKSEEPDKKEESDDKDADASEKDKDEDTEKSAEPEDEKTDDSIMIAHIDNVESADDIPDNDEVIRDNKIWNLDQSKR